MKSLFQNKVMHVITCVLLFWKGISLILWILFDVNAARADFFMSTGFGFPYYTMLTAAASGSRVPAIVILSVGCMAFLAYWIFFVLLATNRSVAGVGSKGILIMLILDLPMAFALSTLELWMFLVFVIFNVAIFIFLIVMRRSRQGARDWFDRPPKSI